MNTSNEAGASQTIKIAYKGCEILVTQRDLEIKMLPFLEQAQKLIDGAFALGFEAPPARGGFGFKKEEKPIVYADHVCPECGAKVVKKTTKTGKNMEECEKRVYDFQTKQTTGCTYQKWL